MKIYKYNELNLISKDLERGIIRKIDKKTYRELTNIIYELKFNKKILEKYILSPSKKDIKERISLNKQTKYVFKELEKDIHSRRAVICYPNHFNKCISLLQFFVRREKININAYYRSQNWKENSKYDIQTLNILMKNLINKMQLDDGKITVIVASLHKEME